MKSHQYAHLIVHVVLQNLMAILYEADAVAETEWRCQDKAVAKPDIA